MWMIAACGPSTSSGPEKPLRFPAYRDCGQFRSDTVRKWCFVRRFSDDLKRIIRHDTALRRNLPPGDTVYARFYVTSEGYIRVDTSYYADDSLTLRVMRRLAVRQDSFPPLRWDDRPPSDVPLVFEIPLVFTAASPDSTAVRSSEFKVD